MKKTAILLLTIALTQSLLAQDNSTKSKLVMLDLQIAQHIGLGSWSGASYVNDGLPETALTEFRGVFNIPFSPYWGFFGDMGIGIMPAPKMRTFSLDRMPMPYNGTQYYLREMLSESGDSKASGHLKMTGGIFGNIPASEKLTVMPYFGVGFVTMPQRKYEMILKEHGSNMQYQTTFIWNRPNDAEYEDAVALGYLTGRLVFKQRLSERLNILLGLEYSWYLNSLDFYGKYTNTFNANIERDFIIKGNKMNMFGLSVGISFMSRGIIVKDFIF